MNGDLSTLYSSYLVAGFVCYQLSMAAPKGHDMTWLQTGWEQNQGRSSHIRHYRTPAPCQKGASRNSLLQCNKMSVKTKQVDDKARQIRFKYGKSNLERNFNKGLDIAPFVTKVQIKKTQERNRSKSTGRASARKRNADERVHFEIPSDESRTLSGDCSDKNALSNQFGDKVEAKTIEENIEDKSDFSVEIMAVEMNAKPEETNYLYPPETSEKERESVQHLIKCLSRRFRDPIETSRKQVTVTRPIAAYARPTKGEIALSMKGPVLLTPVSKFAKATVQASDRQSRLHIRSLPEFAGARNERPRTRPISSVSDSVVLTGRKIHGAGQDTWPECTHAPNGSLDQNHRLCYSCKDRHSSSSETNTTRERAKSAVYCERKIDNGLPKLLRQSPTKLHGRNALTRDSSTKRRNCIRNGMISPHELQINLERLKSYDYGSPVPPPSMSNSDDEEITS